MIFSCWYGFVRFYNIFDFKKKKLILLFSLTYFVGINAYNLMLKSETIMNFIL